MAYFSEEKYDAETTEKIAAHVREILKLLGEDTEREGLLKTPERVAKAMQFMTKGYAQDGVEIIKSAIFDEEYQQMVLIKDIELYSSCEHHMLPFIGKAHVAYIPNGKITGLSKIARVVETYARRLHVQEVLAVEDGFALGNGVERVAGKDGAERGLARTVGAHDGMCFTILDGQVDAFQYLFVANLGV